MKKMTVIILCIAAATCVCGCLSRRGRSEGEYLSDQEASDKMLEESIKYTEEKDTESFMNLFSDFGTDVDFCLDHAAGTKGKKRLGKVR